MLTRRWLLHCHSWNLFRMWVIQGQHLITEGENRCLELMEDRFFLECTCWKWEKFSFAKIIWNYRHLKTVVSEVLCSIRILANELVDVLYKWSFGETLSNNLEVCFALSLMFIEEKRRRAKGWGWNLEATEAFTSSGHFRMLPEGGRGPPGRAKDFNSWCFCLSREPGEREGTWLAWTLGMGELSQGNQGPEGLPLMLLGPSHTATLRRVGSWGQVWWKLTGFACGNFLEERSRKGLLFFPDTCLIASLGVRHLTQCFQLHWHTLIVHGKIQFKKPLGVGIIFFYSEVTLV